MRIWSNGFDRCNHFIEINSFVLEFLSNKSLVVFLNITNGWLLLSMYESGMQEINDAYKYKWKNCNWLKLVIRFCNV